MDSDNPWDHHISLKLMTQYFSTPLTVRTYLNYLHYMSLIDYYVTLYLFIIVSLLLYYYYCIIVLYYVTLYLGIIVLLLYYYIIDSKIMQKTIFKIYVFRYCQIVIVNIYLIIWIILKVMFEKKSFNLAIFQNLEKYLIFICFLNSYPSL